MSTKQNLCQHIVFSKIVVLSPILPTKRLSTTALIVLQSHLHVNPSHKTHIQWKLGITRSLGPIDFVWYIRYFVISVVNKQYKTKEINSLGPEKLVCYVRYVVISGILLYQISLYRVSTVQRFSQNGVERDYCEGVTRLLRDDFTQRC